MDIPDFLQRVRANLSAMHKAQSLYRTRLAPDFTPFQFIRQDEASLSKVIAWLLDPMQTHGQGARFLELFLEKFAVAWPSESCARAKAATEVAIKEGRLDVLVTSGDKILVIENKPWAGDQPGQLCRYFSYLETNKKDSIYSIVYLTGDGDNPSTESLNEIERAHRIDQGQLFLVSYKDGILDWLSGCYSLCQADRVSVFIDEISRYIRISFKGGGDMAMQDHLVSEVTHSADTVLPAMQIIAASDAIRERLLSVLHEQLEAKLVDIGWKLENWIMKTWERFSGFSITFAPQCPFSFSVEFEYTQYNGLIFGIGGKKDRTDNEAVALAITNDMGSGSSNPDWLWYRYSSPQDQVLPIDANWQSSPTTWVAIADGTMATEMVAAASRFRATLKNCGL
jgi:hypothetical protein